MASNNHFAYCSAVPFQDWEPQSIDLHPGVKARLRLTPKGMARLHQMVDGQVSEVDWDVGESSHPIVLTRRFPFWTGRSQRVETTSEDEVFYARVNRGRFPVWARFVRGRKGEMSRHHTVILRPVCDVGLTGWDIVAAYCDEPAPPFPGDRFEKRESSDFWSRYALVEGSMPYHKGTETSVCPW